MALTGTLASAVSPVHLLVSRRTLALRPDLMQRLNQGLLHARQSAERAQLMARSPGL